MGLGENSSRYRCMRGSAVNASLKSVDRSEKCWLRPGSTKKNNRRSMQNRRADLARRHKNVQMSGPKATRRACPERIARSSLSSGLRIPQ